MSNSTQNNIRQVREDYLTRRGIAFEQCEKRKLELYPQIPELREIDLQLSQTGAKVMEAAVSGQNIEDKISLLKKENLKLRAKRAELLVKNGYPADYTDLKYRCEKCSDTGFVGITMCECMRKELAAAMLESSGIGRLAQTQSFETFNLDYYSGKQKEAMEKNYSLLYDFANNFSSDTVDSWLLIGNTGLGKTHLSTAVAVRVIEGGYEVVYETMQEMVDDFANEQFRNASHDTVSKYYDCDLLIVDDLGAELTNQFTVSCLYNLINRRINKRKPTIFSTNLTQTELRERYADRITSRLFGEYKPLVFTGTDIRRQKLTEN